MVLKHIEARFTRFNARAGDAKYLSRVHSDGDTNRFVDRTHDVLHVDHTLDIHDAGLTVVALFFIDCFL